MALLGDAAMILSFDIVETEIAEHDHWHSWEHLQERMSIPGFRRGTRWTSATAAARYFVMYEVADLDTLASEPYLERLNNPSPWTSQMMKHYRGMNRGFCRITASRGIGLGGYGLVVRFSPDPDHEVALHDWLVDEALPALPGTPGVVGVHLFEAALSPEMTQEQRIRGKDGGIDWVLLVTGYDADALESLAGRALSAEELARHGAINVVSGVYQQVHAYAAHEAAGS